MSVDPFAIEDWQNKVRAELVRAVQKFPPMASPHEGYAILLEEVEEAWEDIKKNRFEAAHKEMLQVAAMALRYLIDCEPEE